MATTKVSTSLTAAGQAANKAAEKAISVAQAASVVKTSAAVVAVNVDSTLTETGVRGAYFSQNTAMQDAYLDRFGPAELKYVLLVPPNDASYLPAKTNDQTQIVRKYWRSEWTSYALSPSASTWEYVLSKEKYAYARDRLQALLNYKGPNLQQAADGGYAWCHYVTQMVDCALLATGLDPAVLDRLLSQYIPPSIAQLDVIASNKRNNALYARMVEVRNQLASLGSQYPTKTWRIGAGGSSGYYDRPFRTISINGAPGFHFPSLLQYTSGSAIQQIYAYMRNKPFGEALLGDTLFWGANDTKVSTEYFRFQKTVEIDLPNGHGGPMGIINDLTAWARFIVSRTFEQWVIEGFNIWAQDNVFGLRGPRLSSEDMVVVGDRDKAAAKAQFLTATTFAAQIVKNAASGNGLEVLGNTVAFVQNATADTLSGQFGQPIEQPFRRTFDDADYSTDVSRGTTQEVIARIAANSVRLADLTGIPFAEMFRPKTVPPPVVKAPELPPLYTPVAPVAKSGSTTTTLVVGGLVLVTGLVVVLKLRGR